MMLPVNLYSDHINGKSNLESNVKTAEEIEVKILETKSKADNGKSYYKNE